MSVPEVRRQSSLELAGLRKNGDVFPAEIKLSYVDLPEGAVALAYIVDITRRKQAEQALQHALAQEKELGELKSRFVSMASHEFRTPLATIYATTDTLSNFRHKLPEEQIEQKLVKIRRQVGHMKEIIEDVLEIARFQAGRMEFKPVQADLDALCREIAEEFDSQTPYRGRILYQSNLAPINRMHDIHLMRQVISNLVSNALKYSPDRPPVHLIVNVDSEQTIIEVKDEGIGIPPDDLNRLFEPFHRANNVGTISGTGLGLSIIKHAVELHGGSITVDSHLGVGTTFKVKIPLSLKADSVV
jgi:signal transduction histidine kinase